MEIKKVWNVVKMDCYPETESNVNVVFQVHWSLTGMEDNITGFVYGSINLVEQEDGEFTPFEDLTEEQVIGWVKTALGEEQVQSYERIVDQQIEAQRKPTTISPALPWTNK